MPLACWAGAAPRRAGWQREEFHLVGAGRVASHMRRRLRGRQRARQGLQRSRLCTMRRCPGPARPRSMLKDLGEAEGGGEEGEEGEEEQLAGPGLVGHQVAELSIDRQVFRMLISSGGWAGGVGAERGVRQGREALAPRHLLPACCALTCPAGGACGAVLHGRRPPYPGGSGGAGRGHLSCSRSQLRSSHSICPRPSTPTRLPSLSSFVHAPPPLKSRARAQAPPASTRTTWATGCRSTASATISALWSWRSALASSPCWSARCAQGGVGAGGWARGRGGVGAELSVQWWVLGPPPCFCCAVLRAPEREARLPA